MEDALLKSLETSIPQLGVSIIFIVWSLKLYRDSRKELAEKDKAHKEEIALKDSMLVQMYEKNLDLHNKNIEVMTKLKDVIDGQTKSLDKNTEALISLEKKIIKISD